LSAQQRIHALKRGAVRLVEGAANKERALGPQQVCDARQHWRVDVGRDNNIRTKINVAFFPIIFCKQNKSLTNIRTNTVLVYEARNA
jgi:hypothetical protein